MTDLPIKIRGLLHPEIPLFNEEGVVTNQEKAFIASSWSHKERHNPAYFWVSKRAFHYQFYLGVIVPLIDSRPDLFLVAYNTAKPDQILGWVCSDEQYRRYSHSNAMGYEMDRRWVIYQHYVKEDFREYGVKDMLIGLRDVPNPSEDAKPAEFMELINGLKKNQTAVGTLPGTDACTRTAIHAATGSNGRAESP